MNGWRDYCQCVGNCVEDHVNPDGTTSIRDGNNPDVVLTVPTAELVEYIKGKAFALGLTSA